MEKIKELPFYFYKEFTKKCGCGCGEVKKDVKFELVIEFGEKNGGFMHQNETIKFFGLYYKTTDYFVEKDYDKVIGNKFSLSENLDELIDDLKQELKDKKII